jgi:hypothetical protein
MEKKMISRSWLSLASVLLVLSSGIAHANGSGTGTITFIGGMLPNPSYPASIYVGISPAPINRPACSNNGSYHFVFDPSTAEGKALYAALLSVQASGKQIYIYGTGTCALGQPMEGVSFWNFAS